MSTDYPLAKAAVFSLGQVWPRVVGFDDLLRGARAQLGGGAAIPGAEASTLLDILLAAYAAGLIELSTHAPRFVLEPGSTPTASPVARLQLERGPFVTTLRHTSVCIEDDLGRHLLRLMDGTRSREMLLREMTRLISTVGPRDTLHGTEGSAGGELTVAGIERKIREAARLALLMA